MKRRASSENELVDLSAEARIPELRKREEKEKKAVGVFWSSGAPGSGGALARAATGAGWSPLGFGRLAAALALRVGAGSLAGKLLLSRFGGWTLMGFVLGGGCVIGLWLSTWIAGPGLRRLVALRHGPAGASLVASRERAGDSLSVLASANRGALGEAEAAGKAAEEELLADAPAPGLPAAPLTVEAPLTADAGGEIAGAPRASGTLNKLSEAGASRPLLAGAGPTALATPVQVSPTRAAADVSVGDGRRGSLGSLPRGRGRAAASSLRGRAGRADRAMGQLKLARSESLAGAGAARDTASRQHATNAFEQIKTQGGELAGGPGAGEAAPQVVMPPGSGAPDTTALPKPPATGPTKDVTPYQPALDAAEGMAAAAGMLRMMGMLFMVVGAALMFAGYKILQTPDPNPMKMMGYAMIIAGVAMIGAGVMALAMAQNMADAAGKIGDQIKNQDGQKVQGQIAKDHAKAKADGKAYTPPDMTDKLKPNSEIKKAVADERNADYTLR